MEMYGEYLKEKYNNRKTIEIESDGFIEYEMYPDNSCFIWSFYVKPDKRHKGLGTKLEEMLIKKENPSSISCEVDLKGKNPELSLRKILTQPYKITGTTTYSIILCRELRRDL